MRRLLPICVIAAGSQSLPALPTAIANPHEAAFAAAWAEKLSPAGERPARRNMPNIVQLHRQILTTHITAADRTRQEAISAEFGRNGILGFPHSHYRVTCRGGLCEYVLVYRDRLTPQQSTSATERMNQSVSKLCPPDRCNVFALLTSGKMKGDGAAVLGYFMPLS